MAKLQVRRWAGTMRESSRASCHAAPDRRRTVVCKRLAAPRIRVPAPVAVLLHAGRPMARLKRLVVAGCAHHLVLRGLAATPVFAAPEDFARCTDLLVQWSRRLNVQVHAHALMPTALHALLTPQQAPALGQLVQALGREYTAAFNRRMGRRGTLWQGRFQCAPVEPGPLLVSCMRYIEQAPVRHGLVPRADAYAWSSASHHLGQGALAWLSDPAAYWRLGNTPFEREAAYAALLALPLDEAAVRLVEKATAGGWALGSAAFIDRVSADAQRRAAPGERGRPRAP